MIKIIYRLTLFILLLLVACSRPTLPKLSADSTILAFGDSLTAGYGVSQEFSYPSVLQNITGINVINAGVPGETTDEGVIRLATLLDDEDVDLLLLLEGGNDILRNYEPKQIKKNLAQMIQMAQQRNIPILLIGVPKKSIFSSSASFYQELADEYNVPYENALIAKLLKQNKYKSDFIHFNRQGYKLMAESIADTLKQYGAL